MNEWLKRWLIVFHEHRRRARIRRAAIRFNLSRAKADDLSEWMCPACGKVSKGIQHPYRWLSGLKYPACCTKYCWHGWRSFYGGYIPDRDYPMQPPEEFKP
jgi:hypothetical protein